jgi:hypothetical protein
MLLTAQEATPRRAYSDRSRVETPIDGRSAAEYSGVQSSLAGKNERFLIFLGLDNAAKVWLNNCKGFAQRQV